MSWFEVTHELVRDEAGVRWRRVGLPGPGSIGEQDARLFRALELARLFANDAIKAAAEVVDHA